MIDQEGYLLEIEFRKLEKFVKSHKLYVLTIFCVGDELYHKILKIRKLEGCEVAPYPNKRDARKAANWYYRHNRNVILVTE